MRVKPLQIYVMYFYIHIWFVKLDDSQWNLIQTILNLLKGPWACIIEKYNVWMWLKQPQQNMRVKPLQINLLCFYIHFCVCKLCNSQLKINTNRCQLVEGSISMYHWKNNVWIWSTQPQHKMRAKSLQINLMCLLQTLPVCEN